MLVKYCHNSEKETVLHIWGQDCESYRAGEVTKLASACIDSSCYRVLLNWNRLPGFGSGYSVQVVRRVSHVAADSFSRGFGEPFPSMRQRRTVGDGASGGRPCFVGWRCAMADTCMSGARGILRMRRAWPKTRTATIDDGSMGGGMRYRERAEPLV